MALLFTKNIQRGPKISTHIKFGNRELTYEEKLFVFKNYTQSNFLLLMGGFKKILVEI